MMRQMAMIVAVCLATLMSMPAQADTRFYDAQGRYQGRETADGRFYDKAGRYQGRQTQDGRFYDDKGRYQGRTITR